MLRVLQILDSLLWLNYQSQLQHARGLLISSQMKSKLSLYETFVRDKTGILDYVIIKDCSCANIKTFVLVCIDYKCSCLLVNEHVCIHECLILTLNMMYPVLLTFE